MPSDADHATARDWTHENDFPLLTTDYVVDELLTLLRQRGEIATALAIGPALLNEEYAKLELVTYDDICQAWFVFSTFRDKAWSFTDCVSRVVMQRVGIDQAFAFDAHFRQFGTWLCLKRRRSQPLD